MTRGERMLALRRSRMTASPAFLQGGFRPFFLAGALWAALALALWLLSFVHGTVLPSAMDALSWHRHEMLFGFVSAVVAGFLLTAIPNWTGRLPIAGTPLALLVLLWLAGRAGILFSGVIGHPAAALIDMAFPLLFGLIAAREVTAAGNKRNLPVVVAVLLMALASGLDHTAAAGLLRDDPLVGVRLQIGLVTCLVTLIGGRIIPSFTRNWLVRQGVTDRLPMQPGRFDGSAIGVTAAALLLWVLRPDLSTGGLLLLVAGALQLLRLGRWRGYRTIADPLVLILHLAFLWVPVGLLLLGASILLPAVPQSAAVHALTAGAMGSMILAVMTRATLGHTGRTLRADRVTRALYLAVTLAALLRVSASFLPSFYADLILVSGLLWITAFALFGLRYGPYLCRSRDQIARA